VLISCAVVILVGYGAVLSKLGKKITQLNKLAWLSIFILLFSCVLLIDQLGFVGNSVVYVCGGFLISSEFVIGIKIMLALSSALILLLGMKATVDDQILDYEFTQLVVLSTLGMMFLVGSGDFIMMYLAIELLSLAFYVLASLKRHSQHSTEAGLKYFLLGALSSGLLLFGMAVVYAFTGETSFIGLSEYL